MSRRKKQKQQSSKTSEFRAFALRKQKGNPAAHLSRRSLRKPRIVGIVLALALGTASPLAAQDCRAITGWQSWPFPVQTGAFTAEFDDTPNAAAMDGQTGVAAAPVTSYSQWAANIRFNVSNRIDARRGGAYAATTVVPYTPGVQYHFRMIVDIPRHVYTVYVAPAGGVEVLLAQDFAFRTEQAAVASLSYVGARSFTTGTHTVCNFAIVGAVPPPPAVATVTVAPSPASIAVGSILDFSAIVKDAAGNVLLDRVVTWTSSDAAVLTVNQNGEALAVGAGSAEVRATADGVTGVASVTVTALPPPPPPPPSTIVYTLVAPEGYEVAQTWTTNAVRFVAYAITASGELTACSPTWLIADTTVAISLGGGAIQGIKAGRTDVRASCAGVVGGPAILLVYDIAKQPIAVTIKRAELPLWGLVDLVPGRYKVEVTNDSTDVLHVQQRIVVEP